MKPIDDMFCSIYKQSHSCKVDIKIFQTTVYSYCIKNNIKEFQIALKTNEDLSKANFSLTQRARFIEIAKEIDKQDLIKYFKGDEEISKFLDDVKPKVKNYLQALFEGIKELANSFQMKMGNSFDPMKNDTKLSNINSVSKTKETFSSGKIAIAHAKYTINNYLKEYSKFQSKGNSTFVNKSNYDSSIVKEMNNTKMDVNNIIEEAKELAKKIKAQIGDMKLSENETQLISDLALYNTTLLNDLNKINEPIPIEIFKNLKNDSAHQIQSLIKKRAFKIKLKPYINSNSPCTHNANNITRSKEDNSTIPNKNENNNKTSNSNPVKDKNNNSENRTSLPIDDPSNYNSDDDYNTLKSLCESQGGNSENTIVKKNRNLNLPPEFDNNFNDSIVSVVGNNNKTIEGIKSNLQNMEENKIKQEEMENFTSNQQESGNNENANISDTGKLNSLKNETVQNKNYKSKLNGKATLVKDKNGQNVSSTNIGVVNLNPSNDSINNKIGGNKENLKTEFANLPSNEKFSSQNSNINKVFQASNDKTASSSENKLNSYQINNDKTASDTQNKYVDQIGNKSTINTQNNNLNQIGKDEIVTNTMSNKLDKSSNDKTSTGADNKKVNQLTKDKSDNYLEQKENNSSNNKTEKNLPDNANIRDKDKKRIDKLENSKITKNKDDNSDNRNENNIVGKTVENLENNTINSNPVKSNPDDTKENFEKRIINQLNNDKTGTELKGNSNIDKKVNNQAEGNKNQLNQIGKTDHTLIDYSSNNKSNEENDGKKKKDGEIVANESNVKKGTNKSDTNISNNDNTLKAEGTIRKEANPQSYGKEGTNKSDTNITKNQSKTLKTNDTNGKDLTNNENKILNTEGTDRKEEANLQNNSKEPASKSDLNYSNNRNNTFNTEGTNGKETNQQNNRKEGTNNSTLNKKGTNGIENLNRQIKGEGNSSELSTNQQQKNGSLDNKMKENNPPKENYEQGTSLDNNITNNNNHPLLKQYLDYKYNLEKKGGHVRKSIVYDRFTVSNLQKVFDQINDNQNDDKEAESKYGFSTKKKLKKKKKK